MLKRMLVPEYLLDFKCIGGACEDTCCTGFHVPIGKATYDEYQTIDGDMGDKLREHVQYNEKNKSHVDYSTINATCGCPLITKEGWCSVQLALGEEKLSSACSKYPKSINVVNQNIEKAATLSCPEVARLVLLKKEGLNFTYSEDKIDERDIATIVLDTNMLPMLNHFDLLRESSIEIIQNRNHSLKRRIFVLQYLYYEMNELVKQGKEELIPQLVKMIDIDLFNDEIESVVSKEDVLKELAYFRTVHPFVSRYEEVYQEFLIGINKEGTVGSTFIKEHEYLLENYLVNYMFKHLFPFSYGENVVDAYFMLQLHYDLIVMHIEAVANCLGYMDMDNAVRIIQSWVKEAEHNSIYLAFMFKRIK